MEVQTPLPFVTTAGGFVEKYGPDERYNYLRFAADAPCPTLVTFGGAEVETNMAFRGAPEELRTIAAQHGAWARSSSRRRPLLHRDAGRAGRPRDRLAAWSAGVKWNGLCSSDGGCGYDPGRRESR